MFIALLTIAYFLNYIPQSLLIIYAAGSVISFITYAIDKSKAKRGAWRIPEKTLHLLALLGGWPGAAIAQQTLRHKSQKKKFRIVFWCCVIVNCAALTWFIYTKNIGI